MHQFWDKQPVPHNGEVGEIEIDKSLKDEAFKIPDGFSWVEPSIDEAHKLLKEHYVCDETFRLSYSIETLKWAAEIPGYKNIGISGNETGELIGYVSSVPATVRVIDTPLKMVQINFLCVHPSYRSEGFAPLLISEIKRLANHRGIRQAVYTAVTKIPKPITKAHYWHRFLDVKRLVKTGFYQTNRLREKYFEVRGRSMFRKMSSKDVPKVTKILKKYFEKFKIAPVIDEHWVRYWLLPIHSYVNDETDDFISFYEIPYDRVDGTDTVKQVYGLYMVGDVYNDAFILARNQGYDVFNTLDVGTDPEDLEKLKFMKGTGHNYYYLFNWGLSENPDLKDIQLKLP
jgi:glycylpeptide N-tetradecanoyltransferase